MMVIIGCLVGLWLLCKLERALGLTEPSYRETKSIGTVYETGVREVTDAEGKTVLLHASLAKSYLIGVERKVRRMEEEELDPSIRRGRWPEVIDLMDHSGWRIPENEQEAVRDTLARMVSVPERRMMLNLWGKKRGWAREQNEVEN